MPNTITYLIVLLD